MFWSYEFDYEKKCYECGLIGNMGSDDNECTPYEQDQAFYTWGWRKIPYTKDWLCKDCVPGFCATYVEPINYVI